MGGIFRDASSGMAPGKEIDDLGPLGAGVVDGRRKTCKGFGVDDGRVVGRIEPGIALRYEDAGSGDEGLRLLFG